MRSSYREGDWFAVPLDEGGFAVGLVARANPGGVLLGYFFGPRRKEVPSLEELADLEPSQAGLVAMFGHLGLKGGTWPIIGRSASWRRSDWPMPVFVRYEELTGRLFRVVYKDDDPNEVIGEEQIESVGKEEYPKDGLLGARAAEKVLTALLRRTAALDRARDPFGD